MSNTIDGCLRELAEKLRQGMISLSAAEIEHKALLIEADAERLRYGAPKEQKEQTVEETRNRLYLPSGTEIECDGPGELCFSPIGSVICHRTRLFYNLDSQDKRYLAELVGKAWCKWAVKGEP